MNAVSVPPRPDPNRSNIITWLIAFITGVLTASAIWTTFALYAFMTQGGGFNELLEGFAYSVILSGVGLFGQFLILKHFGFSRIVLALIFSLILLYSYWIVFTALIKGQTNSGVHSSVMYGSLAVVYGFITASILLYLRRSFSLLRPLGLAIITFILFFISYSYTSSVNRQNDQNEYNQAVSSLDFGVLIPVGDYELRSSSLVYSTPHYVEFEIEKPSGTQSSSYFTVTEVYFDNSLRELLNTNSNSCSIMKAESYIITGYKGSNTLWEENPCVKLTATNTGIDVWTNEPTLTSMSGSIEVFAVYQDTLLLYKIPSYQERFTEEKEKWLNHIVQSIDMGHLANKEEINQIVRKALRYYD